MDTKRDKQGMLKCKVCLKMNAHTDIENANS
jgi:hypothetical protein